MPASYQVDDELVAGHKAPRWPNGSSKYNHGRWRGPHDAPDDCGRRASSRWGRDLHAPLFGHGMHARRRHGPRRPLAGPPWPLHVTCSRHTHPYSELRWPCIERCAQASRGMACALLASRPLAAPAAGGATVPGTTTRHEHSGGESTRAARRHVPCALPALVPCAPCPPPPLVPTPPAARSARDAIGRHPKAAADRTWGIFIFHPLSRWLEAGGWRLEAGGCRRGRATGPGGGRGMLRPAEHGATRQPRHHATT